MALLPGPSTEATNGVLNRIRGKLPEMSGTMTKIAELLLEHPRAPLEASIAELARTAGTSIATVTRFCRLIGYTGYAPFRVGIATEVGRIAARESWKTDIGRSFGPQDSASDVLSTLVNAHTRSLLETASILDLPLVKTIAGRIASARHVDLYGIGGSSELAGEMQSRLYRIGINSHNWSEVHAGLASAAIQDSRCVALAISNTGRTEETIQMLGEAKRAGALTVAITNDQDSPLASLADLQIRTSAYEQFLQPDDLSAKHSQLLVLDLLYLLVAQENFDRTSANLAASSAAVSAHRRPRGRTSSSQKVEPNPGR